MANSISGNRLLLKDNPFIPPKRTCPVNNIPPEVLSLIFDIGVRSFEDGGGSDCDNEAMASFWNLEEDAKDDVDEEDSLTRRLELSRVTGDDGQDGDESQEDGLSKLASGSTSFKTAPPFEVLISHVCHHWRTVALSTPSLWTEINVSPLESVPFDHVKTLLERSKSLSVDIHIDCKPPANVKEGIRSSSYPMSFSNLNALMSLLIPHISRWRSIKVVVSSYYHMFVFLSAVSDSSIAGAPQLEALRLHNHEDAKSTTTFAHPNLVNHFKLFGGIAPRLKCVVLWDVHVDWCQEWLSCGSNLSNLGLAYHTEDVRPSWTQFLGILRGAPNLRILSLWCYGPFGTPHDWRSEEGSGDGYPGVIELRSLTDLVLTFQESLCISGLLRRLALPALKNLTVDFAYDDYTDVIAQLAGPAKAAVLAVPSDGEKRRSLLSGLETLKIASLLCSSGSSVELMYKELDNLKTLNLRMADLIPSFLHLLYPVSGQGDIWLPSLTTLSTADVPGHQIVELVRKRKGAGFPLKAVYMEEDDYFTDEDIQWLIENLETFDFFEGSDDGSDSESLPDIEEQRGDTNMFDLCHII